MTKTIFKVLFLATGLTTAKAQNIKDFYIPDLTLYNGAMWYSINGKGERVDLIDEFYYADNKDGTFKVIDIRGGTSDPTAASIKTVKFTKTQVLLIEEEVTGILKARNKTRYSPPYKTLLEMPNNGQTITWTDENEHGETTKYTISWTTVKVEGLTKRALKLVEEPSNGIFFKAQVSYYAEGIGIMKEDIIGADNKLFTLRKFDTLFYNRNFKNR